MGNCVEQFEPAEEVDHGRLRCLQNWTEKRLDAVVLTLPGKDRDLYRLLCKKQLLLKYFSPGDRC